MCFCSVSCSALGLSVIPGIFITKTTLYSGGKMMLTFAKPEYQQTASHCSKDNSRAAFRVRQMMLPASLPGGCRCR